MSETKHGGNTSEKWDQRPQDIPQHEATTNARLPKDHRKYRGSGDSRYWRHSATHNGSHRQDESRYSWRNTGKYDRDYAKPDRISEQRGRDNLKLTGSTETHRNFWRRSDHRDTSAGTTHAQASDAWRASDQFSVQSRPAGEETRAQTTKNTWDHLKSTEIRGMRNIHHTPKYSVVRGHQDRCPGCGDDVSCPHKHVRDLLEDFNLWKTEQIKMLQGASQQSPVIGTCGAMCSDQELFFRQIRNLLHPFERDVGHDTQRQRRPQCPPIADPNRIVKEYRRPAADAACPYPWELRPPEVLVRTMVYLRENILLTSATAGNGPSLQAYNYCADRIRAVRQDLAYQQTTCTDTIRVLVMAVQFYAAAHIWFHANKEFEDYLNSGQLKNVLQTIQFILADAPAVPTKAAIIPNGTGCEFISNDGGEVQVDVSSTQTLQVFLGVADMLFFLQDSTSLQARANAMHAFGCDSSDTAIRSWGSSVMQSYLSRNYVRFFRDLRTTPTWLFVALVHQHLPSVRAHALDVLNTAYATKVTEFPIQDIIQYLCLDSPEDAITLCKHHGITVSEDGMHALFRKGAFTMGDGGTCPVLGSKELMASALRHSSSDEAVLTAACITGVIRS
eukprot:m.483268 g.483268  ORF g.483268 m.483268 type:complete len:616 (-) comp21725_c0_seq1:294-2141(-)